MLRKLAMLAGRDNEHATLLDHCNVDYVRERGGAPMWSVLAHFNAHPTKPAFRGDESMNAIVPDCVLLRLWNEAEAEPASKDVLR